MAAAAFLPAAPAQARRVNAAALSLPSTAALKSERTHFLALARRGVSDAKALWWNHRRRWYNDRLDDHDRYPLATIWSIVPQFEALNAVAIAQPSSSNRRAVKSFAKKAETYFDRSLQPGGGYAPYPGDRGGRERTWFDDNGWWGLAFVDAYRATHSKRFLKDAARALDFSARRGWAKGGGLWWDTAHTRKAGEALASNSALAAMLYEATHKPSYLKQARRFIAWGDAHLWNSRDELYARSDSDSTPMPYVEGPMIGAHETICRAAHDAHACARAEALAEASLSRFGQDVNHGPQYDAIYLRWMLDLSTHDRDPRWYALAYRNAARAGQCARRARRSSRGRGTADRSPGTRRAQGCSRRMRPRSACWRGWRSRRCRQGELAAGPPARRAPAGRRDPVGGRGRVHIPEDLDQHHLRTATGRRFRLGPRGTAAGAPTASPSRRRTRYDLICTPHFVGLAPAARRRLPRLPGRGLSRLRHAAVLRARAGPISDRGDRAEVRALPPAP